MAILVRPSRVALAREWRAQARLRAGFERALFIAVRRELARAGRAAAKGFESGGRAAAEAAIAGHQRNLSRILTAHYNSIMPAFGARILDAGKGIGVPETKDAQSDFSARVQAWIKRIGAAKVKRIAGTTRKQIVAAVLKGQEDGLGQDAIARIIRDKTSGTVGFARSRVIARTEVHASSQVAQTEALDALDIPEVKREWVAAADGRTRESHQIADGQIRKQGKPFNVGGAKLMHPGDPAGPPAEIINCRCIAAAVVAD